MSKAKRSYVLAEDSDNLTMVLEDDIRLEKLDCIKGKFIKRKDAENSKQIGRFVGENKKEYVVFSNRAVKEA